MPVPELYEDELKGDVHLALNQSRSVGCLLHGASCLRFGGDLILPCSWFSLAPCSRQLPEAQRMPGGAQRGPTPSFALLWGGGPASSHLTVLPLQALQAGMASFVELRRPRKFPPLAQYEQVRRRPSPVPSNLHPGDPCPSPSLPQYWFNEAQQHIVLLKGHAFRILPLSQAQQPLSPRKLAKIQPLPLPPPSQPSYPAEPCCSLQAWALNPHSPKHTRSHLLRRRPQGLPLGPVLPRYQAPGDPEGAKHHRSEWLLPDFEPLTHSCPLLLGL